MAVLTYNPADISVSLAGLVDISGFVAGTFIQIEKEVAPYTYQTAMDGETSRTFRTDRNYQMTITLAQSSPSNDVLNALHALDVATQLGKIPVLMRDKQGTTTFFSPNAWIENYPTVSYSNGIESRVWVFKCTECTMLVGGSGEGSALTTLLGAAPTIASFIGG